MAVKRKSKLEDKEQSRRFVETAHKLETDESGKAFKIVLGAIVAKKSRSTRKGSSR